MNKKLFFVVDGRFSFSSVFLLATAVGVGVTGTHELLDALGVELDRDGVQEVTESLPRLGIGAVEVFTGELDCIIVWRAGLTGFLFWVRLTDFLLSTQYTEFLLGFSTIRLYLLAKVNILSLDLKVTPSTL